MKLFKMLVAMTVIFLVGMIAGAQDLVVAVPTQDEWLGFIKMLGTLQGAKSAAIAVAVMQGLLLVGRQYFDKFSGQAKYWIVAGLSFLIALVLELVKAPKIDLQTFFMALMSAPVLMALNILLHQGVKQNIEGKK